MPIQNQTLTELKVLYPQKGESLEDILTRIANRGTVFTSQKPGPERKYRLLPSVVGWAETPFWAGKNTETARKLAPSWLKYRGEAFGDTEAVDLVERETAVPPPDLEKFFTARYKADAPS